MDNKRLFVDMDGTLAVFKKTDTLETLYEQGYFYTLEPIPNVVNAVKTIIKNNPEIEVHILSAVLSDSKFALAEKSQWLDRYLPEIDSSHKIFTVCGEDKKNAIPNGVTPNDFLLDDYTNNLTLWQPPARGIKLLNGINHTNGSWQHDCLRFDKPPHEIAQNIVSIMQGSERIIDEKPERTSSSILASSQEEFKNIEIAGHTDTWSSVDVKSIDDKTFFLMENDEYGDDAAYLIVDENRELICEDVYNGFEETAFLQMFPQAVPIRAMRDTVENLFDLPQNQGYYILDQNKEFAFAISPTAPSPMVLWMRDQDGECCNGSYKNKFESYDLGHTGLNTATIENRLGLAKVQFEISTDSKENFVSSITGIDYIGIDAKVALLCERMTNENNNLLDGIGDDLSKNEFMEYAPMLVRSAEMKNTIQNMLDSDLLCEAEIDGLLMEKNIIETAINVCNRNYVYDFDIKVCDVVSDIAVANIERQIKQDLFKSTNLSYEIKSVINDFSNNNSYDKLKLLCNYVKHESTLSILQICDIADTISDSGNLEFIANLSQEGQNAVLNSLTKERIGEAEKFCLTTEHCLPESGTSLKNQFIILKPQVLRGEYRNAENQMCFATGGFGCEHGSRGRAVFTENIFDDSKARWNAEDIIGIVDNDKVPDYIQNMMSSFLETRENVNPENLNSQDLER